MSSPAVFVPVAVVFFHPLTVAAVTVVEILVFALVKLVESVLAPILRLSSIQQFPSANLPIA